MAVGQTQVHPREGGPVEALSPLSPHSEGQQCPRHCLRRAESLPDFLGVLSWRPAFPIGLFSRNGSCPSMAVTCTSFV